MAKEIKFGAEARAALNFFCHDDCPPKIMSI